MAFWSKDRDKAPQDPQALVARKEYDKAIKAYRTLIAAQPGNHVLNHKVADVLCLAGKLRDSLPDYSAAADGYAREGFLIKAVAILKKMQRLDPGNRSVEHRLAKLGRVASSSPSVDLPAPPQGLPAGDGNLEIALDMEALDDTKPIPVASVEDAQPPIASKIAATPLFSEMTPPELTEVLGKLRHHEFPAGSVLVKEGDPGQSLFVVSEGRVMVSTRDPRGKDVTLAEMKEGDFFGEVALLTGKPRTATITSVEDTDVLELTRADLGALEARHPRVRQVIQEFYERRVASTIEAMIQASRGSNRRPPG
jgi:cAMP-dependent protein kinase regulator